MRVCTERKTRERKILQCNAYIYFLHPDIYIYICVCRDVRNTANGEVIDQKVLRIRAFNSLRFTDVTERTPDIEADRLRLAVPVKSDLF